MNQSLTIQSITLPEFALTPEVENARENALRLAAMCAKVDDDAANLRAGNALRELSELRRAIEKAREDAKRPALEYGRRLDAVCKGLTEELGPEEKRIGRLMGDYAALVRQRKAAEAAKIREELEARERERQAELAKAATLDDVDSVNERFNAESAALTAAETAVAAPTKDVPGAVATSDWDVMVTNVWDLARAHPTCVTITPKIGEIKALLKLSVKVAGVTAVRVESVSIRGRGKIIDVQGEQV